jgi:hypothetical protein
MKQLVPLLSLSLCLSLAPALAGCDATSPDGAPAAGEEAGQGTEGVDACPVPDGVPSGGQKRFYYGVNFAWDNFSADFGGISKWGMKGVSGSTSTFKAQLADMRKSGARVVRWWIFPDLRGDGVVVDKSGTPVSLGGTAKADLEAALQLAEETDVYLMLCLFSFDGFYPSRDVSGLWVPSLSPIVKDDGRRAELMKNVVRPLARAVEQSKHRSRVVAWDVINEPEWAMSGTNPYGDPPYTPPKELSTVSHAQMERFVKDTITALRAESSRLITVGSAGVKWGHAWKHVGVDFYQVHWYDWLTPYYPLDKAPSDYGLDDKPVVVGEMPVSGLGGKSFASLASTFLDIGYAGALAWDYTEMNASEKSDASAFAKAYACETNLGPSSGKACTNVPPDAKYTCAQQAGWGKCNEPWMAGKCDQSCGRCK